MGSHESIKHPRTPLLLQFLWNSRNGSLLKIDLFSQCICEFLLFNVLDNDYPNTCTYVFSQGKYSNNSGMHLCSEVYRKF